MLEGKARRFVAADASCSALLRDTELEVALALCSAAGRRETGGVIIGRYTAALDCAVITELSPPPPDSRADSSRFERGVQGLRNLLRARWKREGTYYLGEWHFHPFAKAEPSSIDEAGIATIARDHRSRCPEPLLLIIGGEPSAGSELRLHVWRHGRALIPMHPRRSKAP